MFMYLCNFIFRRAGETLEEKEKTELKQAVHAPRLRIPEINNKHQRLDDVAPQPPDSSRSTMFSNMLPMCPRCSNATRRQHPDPAVWRQAR